MPLAKHCSSKEVLNSGVGDDQVRPSSMVTDATLRLLGVPLDARKVQLYVVRQDRVIRPSV